MPARIESMGRRRLVQLVRERSQGTRGFPLSHIRMAHILGAVSRAIRCHFLTQLDIYLFISEFSAAEPARGKRKGDIATSDSFSPCCAYRRFDGCRFCDRLPVDRDFAEKDPLNFYRLVSRSTTAETRFVVAMTRSPCVSSFSPPQIPPRTARRVSLPSRDRSRVSFLRLHIVIRRIIIAIAAQSARLLTGGIEFPKT